MSVKDFTPRIPPGSTAVLSLFLVSILAVAAFAAPALAASVTVVADGQTRTLARISGNHVPGLLQGDDHHNLSLGSP